MRSSTIRLISIFVIFVAALGGGILVLRGSDDGSSNGNGSGGKSAGSDFWQVGDEWTVQVAQDGGAIAPDGGSTSVAKIPFRFTVMDSPATSSEPWIVKVEQDGAEGPFAAGWRLYYVERDGGMELSKVAMGGATDKPLEAELATIVLGSQFPYEVRYETAPKDKTVTAADLIERSSLPPSSAVPGSNGTGGPAGAPTAPPIDEAVAPGNTAPATPKR